MPPILILMDHPLLSLLLHGTTQMKPGGDGYLAFQYIIEIIFHRQSDCDSELQYQVPTGTVFLRTILMDDVQNLFFGNENYFQSRDPIFGAPSFHPKFAEDDVQFLRSLFSSFFKTTLVAVKQEENGSAKKPTSQSS
jgi:hypothetical protein